MVSHGNGTVMVMVMVWVKCVGLVWFGLVWVRKVKRMDEMDEAMMKHFACTSSLAH